MNRPNKKLKSWIEAMRLRTLPVSVAGVVAGGGCAAYFNSFKPLPFFVCLLFAVCAQIVSNFANEYFDYKNGLDRKGREGFRRGVTEGDISPKAMRNATFGLLAFTCLAGCSLIYWGGWWLIAVGVAIAIFALAYSAGPYPLSHHGLGEIAVIIFFGIVPVTLTCYLEAPSWETLQLSGPVSLAIGLMGANVLLVNNYRDIDDDKKVGKKTLAVRFGRTFTERLYLINGLLAAACIIWGTIAIIPYYWQLGTLIYVNVHYILWQQIKASRGRELNPMLGKTSMLMLGAAAWILIAFICK